MAESPKFLLEQFGHCGLWGIYHVRHCISSFH